MIDVVVIRDPDASNDIRVFGDEANIFDVDLGYADLNDAEEFREWQQGLREDMVRAHTVAAQQLIAEAVQNAADAHGQMTPPWTELVLSPPQVKLTADGWVLVQ